MFDYNLMSIIQSNLLYRPLVYKDHLLIHILHIPRCILSHVIEPAYKDQLCKSTKFSWSLERSLYTSFTVLNFVVESLQQLTSVSQNVEEQILAVQSSLFITRLVSPRNRI